MANTKYTNTRYLLGQRDSEGRLFLLDGEHRTRDAATSAWRAFPRNGVALLIEEQDAVRLGVVYGTRREIVATL